MRNNKRKKNGFILYLLRVLIAFLVALVLILLIFKIFSPKNVPLYYNCNDTRTINNISSQRANLSLNTDSIDLKCDIGGHMTIFFNHALINGVHEGDITDTKHQIGNFDVLFNDENSYIEIKGENTDSFNFNSYIYNEPVHELETNNSKTESSNSKLVTSNINKYKEIGDKTDRQFIISGQSFEINSKSNCILSFNNCTVTYNENPIDKDITLFHSNSNEHNLFLAEVPKSTKNTIQLTALLDSVTFTGNAEYYNVSNAMIQGIGELDFTFSSPSKCELNLQELFLESKNNLVVTCDFLEDNQINTNVNGVVTDARLMNYSFFPTFKGWILDNIFLLPTVIISSIFIPILNDISKILIKKKNEDDEDDEDDD